MFRATVLLTAALGLAAARPAAAQFAWTGGGTTDNWTDGGNWGGTVPTSGTAAQVTFGTGPRLSPVLDTGSLPFDLNTLTFAGPDGYTLGATGGASLLFTGPSAGVAQNSAADQRVMAPVAFAAGGSVSGTGAGGLTFDSLTLSGGALTVTRSVTAASLTLGGDLELGDLGGGDPITVSGSVDLGADTRTIRDLGGRSETLGFVDVNIAASFTGAGGLVLDLSTDLSPKGVALSGASNYSGPTAILLSDFALAFVGRADALPTGTELTVAATGAGGGGTLFLGVGIDEAGLTAGNYSLTVGSLAGNAGIVTDPDPSKPGAAVTVGSAGTDTDYAGSISGTGSVTKVGGGVQTFSGDSTYSGTTTLVGGTLRVDGSLGATSVTVTGGTLAGSGSVGGPVAVAAGGTVRAGTSAATSTLTVAGGVTVASGTVDVNLFGATASGASVGTLAVGGGNALNLDTASGPVIFHLTDDNRLLAGTSYTFVVATSDGGFGRNGSAVTSYAAGTDFILTSGTFAGFTNVSLIATGNTLSLSFTPTPEPACVLGLAVAGFGVVAASRRWARSP